MKAIIPTKFCTIEIDCDSVKDVFREVGGISEIFNEEKCGLCGNTAIMPKTRSVEKNKKVYEYFEMGCTNSKCRARLSYGSDKMAVVFSQYASLILMVSLIVKLVLMVHIMVGANIEAKTKMSDVGIDVSSLKTEELKKELLWLDGYDTEWSKEISKLIKEELKLRDIQVQST